MSILRKIADFALRQADVAQDRKLFSLLEKNADAKFLDCGCGNGRMTMAVAKKIGTNSIYGVDILQENVDKAKAMGVEARQGDLNGRLPFDSESFDVVLVNHVIEHLGDTDVLPAELHRVLKKGGYVLALTPNLAALHNILGLLFGRQPHMAHVSDKVQLGSWSMAKEYRPVGGNDPAHRRMFTHRALKELLEYYGLDVEKYVSAGFLPFPRPLADAMCLIDKTHGTNIIVKARKNK